VTIGDSQTYGNGVPLEQAWPHVLAERMGDATAVYDMSTGGWGAAQYLSRWESAAFFEPQMVVIAFYTGNDPRDAYHAAYGVARYAFLRPDPALTLEDLPPVRYPSPPSELWKIRFGVDASMVFTPALRLASNVDHAAVAAGWEIMARVAERMLDDAARGGPRPIFTILPTKERVFEERLRRAGAPPHPAYDALVGGEGDFTAELTRRIERAGGDVVDVAGPLRDAALGSLDLYPSGRDGHLAAPGHAIVARHMHEHVETLLR
jgi:hypothetical protein